MNTTECKDCGHAVSPNARVCPSCGCPLRREWHPVAAAICSAVIPGAGQWYKGDRLSGVFMFGMAAGGYLLGAAGSVAGSALFVPIALFLHALIVIDAAASIPND